MHVNEGHPADEAAVRTTKPFARFWRTVLVILTLGIYAGFAPFGYLGFMLLTLVPARDPVRRAARLQRIFGFAFAHMHRWLRFIGLLDFDPRDVVEQLPDGPCVVVANHLSLLDTSALFAALRGGCAVAKPAIYRQWWIRPLLREAGQIPGTNDPLGAERVIEAATQRLRQGFWVMVFPEGTRAREGRRGPFRRAAFEIACRAEVPVVPIRIELSPPWLTPERSFLPVPRRAPRLRLRVLPSVDPADHDHDSRALRTAVENVYDHPLSETRVQAISNNQASEPSPAPAPG